jgi:hypothetical protein
MPLDERMRETFQRIEASIEPDIERGLRATTERAGGRLVASSLAWVAAAAAVVLVVAVIVRGSMGVDPGGAGSSPGAGPTSSASAASSYDAIAGSYRVDLAPGDPNVLELGLAGQWTMTLDATGAIDLTPPASFTGSRATGHTFSLDGDSLRTDLYYNDYCDSVGGYRWTRADDELALTPIDDACAIRETLLSTHPWSPEP